MKSDAIFWREALQKLAQKTVAPISLMEVCGSHSFAIARYGLRSILPNSVSLLSGPGCPVCVSGSRFIDRAISLCRRGVKVAVFGDLLRIPGSEGTLRSEPGILVIYSPEEALDYAKLHPREEIVFAAVGFEPTLSAGAALLESVERQKVENFSLLTDFKRLRPVLDGLACDPEVKLNGFILPGHVASVIGVRGFQNLALPGVISGFSAENILHSILLLMERIAKGGAPEIVNNYPQLVAEDGNQTALELIDRCFEPVSGEWRGLGRVENGCWRIRKELERFDASVKYSFPEDASAAEPPGCRCGEILRGRLRPKQCPLFGRTCRPEHPVGACMVSGEGACAAAYRYEETV